MRLRKVGSAVFLVGLPALVFAADSIGEGRAPGHRDEPPAGFSGGFGEQACDACHFSFDVNAMPGALQILGAPPRYAPGETYPLTLLLTRPGMAVGGVQLTARFEKGGAQAGSLMPAEGEASRLTVSSSFDIEYAQHLRTGTALVAADTARWTVLWTAPESGGAVQFNGAANAANQDDSQFGDYIYTAVEISGP
ncbi:MAG: choice-of-anchor V domain-containing protein [Gemmatimonadota bacterium]